MLGAIGRGGSLAAMNFMLKSDLVLALGTRLDEFTFVPYYDFQYAPEGAVWIQVNEDPDTLDRSRWVDYAVMADVSQTLYALSKAMRSFGFKKNKMILNEVKAEKSRHMKQLAETYGRPHQNLTAPDVYLALRKRLPRDFIATVDIGATPAYAYSLLEYHASKSLIATGPFAGIGFSIPAAIGAKIAAPKRSVYAFVGDGAFTMELPALITSVEYGIGINVVVCDNGEWGAEKANQRDFYEGRYVGTNLKNPDFAEVVRALGGNPTVVERKEELDKAVKEAFERKGLNVLIAKVDPKDLPAPARKDALKKPLRGLFH